MLFKVLVLATVHSVLRKFHLSSVSKRTIERKRILERFESTIQTLIFYLGNIIAQYTSIEEYKQRSSNVASIIIYVATNTLNTIVL